MRVLKSEGMVFSILANQTEAMHRHLDVAPLNWNVTVFGSVVDPFEVVGAETVLFSVFVHPIVSAAAEKS
jgi:hypothetical protein